MVCAHNGGSRKREDPKALPLVGFQEAKLSLMEHLQYDQAVGPSQVEIRVKTERQRLSL